MSLEFTFYNTKLINSTFIYELKVTNRFEKYFVDGNFAEFK